VTRVVIATVAVLVALMTLAHRAKAHDWYPIECCSGMDCAPVEKVEIVPADQFPGASSFVAAPSAMYVTTKHGTALVPANATRRESQDSRMHACMRKDQYTGAMKLICVFMAPGN
jgi:hypothetical protein